MAKKTKPAEPESARSPEMAEDKGRALAELFPEALSEGQLDVTALKRTLGESFVIEGGERYSLTWEGTSEAYRVLQVPTAATLRSQPEPLLALKPREVVALDSVFHNSDELKSNLDLACRDAEVTFTSL